jgi:carbonic anhydrase
MMNASKVLTRLIEGNQRYVAGKLERPNQNKERISESSTGQSPFAIILSCADSRAIPELIFDTGLGDLFVVRVAGNIANTSSIASIEYAVANLGSSLIVVMGHQSCGAVTAAVEGGDLGKNLNHLVDHIKPAISKARDPHSIDEVIHVNAIHTKESLLKNSTIIAEAFQSKTLDIVSAYYSLETGKVEWLM